MSQAACITKDLCMTIHGRDSKPSAPWYEISPHRKTEKRRKDCFILHRSLKELFGGGYLRTKES